jgi:hypothetical protein
MFEETKACRVYPLLARRPGWTVCEHPSGMLIWRSPSGRHYLSRPDTTPEVVPEPPEARGEPALRA